MVKTLVIKDQSPGMHSVIWDGIDFFGNLVVSGVYFYSLDVGEYKFTNKMLLLE